MRPKWRGSYQCRIFVCASLIILHLCLTSATSDCEFTVHKQSAEYFKKWLRILDGLFAHIDVEFAPHIKYNATSDVIFTNSWVWTFVPPGGARFYISWPAEYYVYSFGLLDSQTLKGVVKLHMDVAPDNCTIIFGEKQTVKRLAYAFFKMLQEHKFDEVSAFYDYSYWCYLAAGQSFNYDASLYLNQYLGVPFQLFGYKCCNNSNISNPDPMCNSEIISWHSSQFFPFILGFIFFAYFPLVVMKCSHRAMTYGKGLHDSVSIDDDDQYIFIKKQGPMTISRLALSVCGIAEKHPLCASRIRRAAFVLLSPVLVYIFMFIFYRSRGKDLVTQLVKRKIPLGFISAVGGFTESMKLFLPMFGGPVISLCLYNVVGLVLIVSPKRLGDVLCHGLPSYQSSYNTLLNIDIRSIEKYSMVKCTHQCGYRRVYSVTKGSLCMLANPSFWKFLFSFIRKRWFSLRCTMKRGCNRYVVFIIYLPALLLYLLLSLIEITILIIFKGFPICFFTVCCIRGFPTSFRSAQRGHPYYCNIMSAIIFPVFYLICVFMQTMITLQSFIMVGNFLFCVYLSLNLFPARAFGFVYFFIMFFIYANSLFREFEKEYKDILYYIIKACKKQERDVIASELYNNGKPNDMIFMVLTKKVASNLPLPALQIQYGGLDGCLRYKGHIPGIHKELYRYVIDKCRPVFQSVTTLFAQIIIVQIIVLLSVIFIARYIKNVASAEYSEVLAVVSAVCVTMIPNITHHLFAKTHDEKIRKKKILGIVIEYWHTRRGIPPT